MENNTLVLGLWHIGIDAAVTGYFIDDAGVRIDDAVSIVGVNLTCTLLEALNQCAGMNALHLAVFTNSEPLCRLWSKPVRLALPEKHQTLTYRPLGSAYKRLGKPKPMPCGNDDQWACARAIGRYKKYKMFHVRQLPKTEEFFWGSLLQSIDDANPLSY